MFNKVASKPEKWLIYILLQRGHQQIPASAKYKWVESPTKEKK